MRLWLGLRVRDRCAKVSTQSDLHYNFFFFFATFSDVVFDAESEKNGPVGLRNRESG